MMLRMKLLHLLVLHRGMPTEPVHGDPSTAAISVEMRHRLRLRFALALGANWRQVRHCKVVATLGSCGHQYNLLDIDKMLNECHAAAKLTAVRESM
jgi:hypothetical protein